MGNFEKLIVLTVLFVAAIVLAVTLNRGKGDAEAAGPLSAAQARLSHEEAPVETERRLPALDANASAASGSVEPSLLLHAGAEEPSPAPESSQAAAAEASNAPTLSLEPTSDTDQRILRNTTGLQPSFMDDYMVYTAAAGDTWSGLAQRFYQDGRFTRNLHQANEGLEELEAGTSILVPVYDFFRQEAGLRPALDPAASGGTDVAASKAGAAPPAAPDEYVVQSGDTLSDISLAVFGTATRWKELFDANRDKLSSPEWLQVGTKLKIPAGGKIPALKPAAKVDGKKSAKTAQSTKTKKVQ